jgi:soluble cytochrome b562
MSLRDAATSQVVEPAGYAIGTTPPVQQAAAVAPTPAVPKTDVITRTAAVSPAPKAPSAAEVAQAVAIVSKAAEVVPATTVSQAPAVSEVKPKAAPPTSDDIPAITSSDEFGIYRIPRTVEGRKELSRKLLAEARQHLAGGKIEAAQKIVYQLKELAVEYGAFEDNPTKLQADISKSRTFSDVLYQDLKEL